jgi:hypothetical protein
MAAPACDFARARKDDSVGLRGSPVQPCRTSPARGGSKPLVIDKILVHTSCSFGGIVGVYQRHEFVAEKRAALEAWGKWLAVLNANVHANVITLRGAV